MITTVTLNASIDRTLVVPNLATGRRLRATKGITLAGGRGLTMARTFKRLDRGVVASGLAGGLTGRNIVARVTNEGVLNDFLTIAEPSRTTTSMIDPLRGELTEIHEYGPDVTDAELEQFSAKLRYLARASTAIVFAGTLPRTADVDTYARLIRLVRSEHDLPIALAFTGDRAVLEATLAAEPTWTFLSQEDAEAIAGQELTSSEDALAAAEAAARMGGRSVAVIWDGGIVARERRGRTVNAVKAPWIDVEDVSRVGRDDTVVAGFLDAWIDESSVEDCVAQAVAVAAANALVLGGGVFDPTSIPALKLTAHVEQCSSEPAAH